MRGISIIPSPTMLSTLLLLHSTLTLLITPATAKLGQLGQASSPSNHDHDPSDPSSHRKLGWAGQTFSTPDELSQLSSLSPQDRLLQLIKTLWPECRNKDAHWCKDLIDDELSQLTFPGSEEINSVILYTRSKTHPTYNAVVIPLDDDDLCVGRDGDGLVHYDFTDWCGLGVKLTDPEDIEASSALINPSKYTLSIPIVPNKKCPDGVRINSMPVDSIGGDFDPNACSTLDGYDAMRETVKMISRLPNAGCRPIGPWFCAGMTCKDTCAMIKHLVPDANTDYKQIECWCSYKDGTAKKLQSQTDTKVRIYANHLNDRVVGVPELKEGTLGPALP